MNKDDIMKVKNAVFAVGDGKVLEDVMLGIIMAKAAMVVTACDGDGTKAKAMLDHYHAIMIDAVPVYCRGDNVLQ